MTVVGLPFGISRPIGGELGAALHASQFVFAALMVLPRVSGHAFHGGLSTRFAGTADLSYCIYSDHLALFDTIQLLASWHVNDVGRFGPWAPRRAVRGNYRGRLRLAALSQRWIENPFLKLKRYFGPHRPHERRRGRERCRAASRSVRRAAGVGRAAGQRLIEVR